MDYTDVAALFKGKTVALVGSGPGVLDNEPGFIDSHDIVVRVNNYKTDEYTGWRTDVYYSFFGVSIKKDRRELMTAGCQLCMCKLPNENFINSNWHRAHNKEAGVDFKRIYRRRKDWWFCDTYVPHKERLESYMACIKGRMPTTGFAAILDILSFGCETYITGFDFFQSQIHNVNERWSPGHKKDPIGHKPELELQWLKDNYHNFRITFDNELSKCIGIKTNSTPII